MTWQVWTFFAVTETALCLLPGPAVLFVLSQALTRGARRTVWSIFGIIAANSVYFVLSATGIGAILIASYDVFFAVKWIGAAYLIYLGVTAFLGRSQVLSVVPGTPSHMGLGRMFVNGFVLQMSNPKALLFFTALLPQFINPHAAVWPQVLILALTSVVIELFVQLLYATAADRASHLAARPAFARITNRVAGSLMIAAGLGLAAARRS